MITKKKTIRIILFFIYFAYRTIRPPDEVKVDTLINTVDDHEAY